MADCTKCVSADSCERVWKGKDNPVCIGFKPSRTNADNVRAMNDEELAEFILYGYGIREYLSHRLGIFVNDGPKKADILDWLKQEAKNEV